MSKERIKTLQTRFDRIMAEKTSVTLECPHCGDIFEVTLFNGVKKADIDGMPCADCVEDGFGRETPEEKFKRLTDGDL